MNFLAHVFLSGTEIPLAVGNLVADRIKGAQYLNYEQNIQKGILLHQDIDSYTDVHPYFKQCASILFPKYRHYSRVIVDLFLFIVWRQIGRISIRSLWHNFLKTFTTH